MKKHFLRSFLVIAPLAFGIASAQSVPPMRGWDVPPAGRGTYMEVWWQWNRYSADGSSHMIAWSATNYRDSLTGERGSTLYLNEYLPNWTGGRGLSCTIPGQTSVHDGPADTASVAISVDVAAFCNTWGYQWVFDPESGMSQLEDWPFPETVELEATVMYPDTVVQRKVSDQYTIDSTGEKTYRRCNEEYRYDHMQGGFTLFGIYRYIGPRTFPDGGYRESTGSFQSSNCINVGQ
jgi:hypothetical protein